MSLHFGRLLALAADGRQEVLIHIVFPIAELPVTFEFLRLIVVIVDVEPCVVREVSESHLIKALKEHVVSCRLIRRVVAALLIR